jgi:membrane-associated protease RseP (regulator of RpoE activity)
LSIGGVGTAGILEAVIKEANEAVGLELRLGKSTGGGSDHASFYAKKIPCLFFVAGGNPDYHSPRDTVDKIDFDLLTKTSKLVYFVAARLSASDKKPVFVAVPRRARAQGKGVRLGFFPDDWYDGKGALMERVMSDTPASRAGLKAGDIILEYGGKKVESIAELRTMLRETKRGATVQLVILRDGKTRTVTVKF